LTVSLAQLSPEIHQWYNNILVSSKHGSKQPWGAGMEVLNASSNFDNILSIGMKKSVLMGMHGHGFCCKKGKKEIKCVV
jgi:hypothetical protein